MRPWQDSNLQSLVLSLPPWPRRGREGAKMKSNALSIRPRGHAQVVDTLMLQNIFFRIKQLAGSEIAVAFFAIFGCNRSKKLQPHGIRTI